MKNLYKSLLGLLLLSGLSFLLSACVVDGVVADDMYYGRHRDPWFHDGPWMDGHRGNWGEPGPSVGVYIHPPRGRR